MTDDEGTDLKCSRCNQRIVWHPADLTDHTTRLSGPETLDLLRAVVHHGYTCEGQPDE